MTLERSLKCYNILKSFIHAYIFINFFSPLVALIGDLAKSCHLCFCLISIHFKGIFWKLLVYVYKAI